MTTCCFYKHKCVESGFERVDMAVVELKGFIKNQVLFLLMIKISKHYQKDPELIYNKSDGFTI